MDDHPAKRLKAISTFEHLSIEIILNIFEYLNVNEILQSFSNLNSFIASCLSNQHHRIRLHLNDEMISLPENYSPGQVISLRIDKIVISIGQFINLKSLFIIYKCDWENYCLNMIMEVNTKKCDCFNWKEKNLYIFNLDIEIISIDQFSIVISWF